MNVTSVEERRNLLSKYGRCFICARKGHISSNCDSKMLCSTRYRVRPVALTMVIMMSRRMPINLAMPVPPFMSDQRGG